MDKTKGDDKKGYAMSKQTTVTVEGELEGSGSGGVSLGGGGGVSANNGVEG